MQPPSDSMLEAPPFGEKDRVENDGEDHGENLTPT